MGIGSTFLIGEPFLLTLLFDQLFVQLFCRPYLFFEFQECFSPWLENSKKQGPVLDIIMGGSGNENSAGSREKQASKYFFWFSRFIV
jgi:hypothetical protein